MTGTASCRPARLVRFDDTADAVADGLADRRRQLVDALEAYRASCDGPYKVPTAGTGTLVRSFGGGLRDFGNWVGDVGRAFEDAAVARAFTGEPGSTDFEGLIMFGEDEVLGYLDHYLGGDDPYRGIPEGAGRLLASGLGMEYDQNEPPVWIGYLQRPGQAATILGPVLSELQGVMEAHPRAIPATVVLTSSELLVQGDTAILAAYASVNEARLLLPRAGTAAVTTAARWVNRVSFALDALIAGGGQWAADEGLPTPERVGRTATRGIGVAGASAALAQAGIAAGTVCGPAAPACSAVLGVAGAFAGAVGGDWIVDQLPWMDPNEQLPAEHDLGDLREGIGAADAHAADPGVAASVDLMASDMALAASADDPAFQARVAGLLPDHDRLAHVAATGMPVPVPPGTTTTTTVPDPRPVEPDSTTPDPWPGERPYEVYES